MLLVAEDIDRLLLLQLVFADACPCRDLGKMPSVYHKKASRHNAAGGVRQYIAAIDLWGTVSILAMGKTNE
jgi:hypothetical protein